VEQKVLVVQRVAPEVQVQQQQLVLVEVVEIMMEKQ
jgi:putative transposon-encoded protein